MLPIRSVVCWAVVDMQLIDHCEWHNISFRPTNCHYANGLNETPKRSRGHIVLFLVTAVFQGSERARQTPSTNLEGKLAAKNKIHLATNKE